jgi:hypothetical protein
MMLVKAAQHKPARRLWVGVHVVTADAVDRPGVEQILDGGLHQPQIGQDAQQHQRGQQCQGEQEERLPQMGDLADEGQGDHGAGDGGKVQRRAAVAVGDGGGAGGPQGEVFGGQGLQQLPLALGVPAGLLWSGWHHGRRREGLLGSGAVGGRHGCSLHKR